jgi:hypothetical protein
MAWGDWVGKVWHAKAFRIVMLTLLNAIAVHLVGLLALHLSFDALTEGTFGLLISVATVFEALVFIEEWEHPVVRFVLGMLLLNLVVVLLILRSPRVPDMVKQLSKVTLVALDAVLIVNRFNGGDDQLF